MLDPLFREAFCHSPQGHTVLGRKLHPFCAFDLLSLEAIDSPFLEPDGKCEVHDLLLCVWILSNPIPEDLTIGNLELGAAGKTWVKSVTKTIDMKRDCGLVMTYFSDYHSPPEIMADKELNPNPLSALGAPWMVSTVIGVCRHLHLPLRTAWTMGVGQLLWYRAALMEMDDPEKRIVSLALREEMKAAAQPQTVYKMEPGETLDTFAARVHLSPEVAAMLLHQGGN